MLRRSAIVFIMSFTALAAGCGSSDTSSSAATTPVASAPVETVAVGVPPTTAQAQTGGIGDAIQVAVGGIDDATNAACDTTRRTFEVASEAFYIMNGSLPTSQAELVEADILREPSTDFQIAPDGSIQPIASGRCVGR
jgi:hypothetical protein